VFQARIFAWLAIAGVMAIMLIWNVLMLSLNGILY